MEAAFELPVAVLFAMVFGLLHGNVDTGLLALFFSLDGHRLPFATFVHAVMFSTREQSSTLVGTLGSLGSAAGNLEGLSTAGTGQLDGFLAGRTVSRVTFSGTLVVARREGFRTCQGTSGDGVCAFCSLDAEIFNLGLATVTVGLSCRNERTFVADEGVAGFFAFMNTTVKQRVADVFTRVPTVQGLHLLVHMARDVLF